MINQRQEWNDGVVRWLFADRNGSVDVSLRPGFPAYISNLWVDPDGRGHGKGSELMRLAENTARREGYLCAMLGVRHGTDPRLTEWYRSRGYREISRLNEYTLLEKQLIAN